MTALILPLIKSEVKFPTLPYTLPNIERFEVAILSIVKSLGALMA